MNGQSDHLDLKRSRVCVTGSGGFLGSFVVEALRARGASNLILPRRKDFDLTKEESIERLFEQSRPEVLFHLAAVVGGIGANEKNPGSFFYQNAIMGIQLIEYARRYGVQKVIVVGTICAYPKFAPVPFNEDALWDGYPEETNAPYGIAKKALLVQCQAYRQQYGMNSIYVLPVNLYGPRDNFDLESSHVIPALIRKMVEAKRVGDCADALVLAAERFNGAEPVNLGSGEEIAIRDLVEMVAEMVGYRGNIVWDTSRPNGQPRRKLDITRAERSFGFTAKTTLRDGLQKTIAWYLDAMPEAVPA